MHSGTRYPILLRDLSWLSFNERVLQESNDPSVPLYERLRFLGIFSNNLDEFFRVRVASLMRMLRLSGVGKKFRENNPSEVLQAIQQVVLDQQKRFEHIYAGLLKEMKKEGIEMVNERQLNRVQKQFVDDYFNEKVRTNIAPIIIEGIRGLPSLNDKSIYLACTLSRKPDGDTQRYALIEIPTQTLPRFIILPSAKSKTHIMLLEDVIRFSLPKLFAQFGFNHFEGYIIKVTRDAELDIDNDIQSDLITSLEKGLKNRKKGKALRLVYDKNIQKNLLDYLIVLFNLNKHDHLVAGGRIHNFKDFMNFPRSVFPKTTQRSKPFVHPLLKQPVRILKVLDERDVMLHFPYHSFDSMIDLLREAAIDPEVECIKITCYRLAKDSKIINALLNAVRNGKQVIIVIELKARFDEEANLRWKRILEEENVTVLVGLPEMKIHAKICHITKRHGKQKKAYGFISTGNLNESTAAIYGDHCLLTSHPGLLRDVEKVFQFIQKPTQKKLLQQCKYLVVSPYNTRSFFQTKLLQELKHKQQGKRAEVKIKLNSLADPQLIRTIYTLAEKGVSIQLIIRSIFCAITEHKQWPAPLKATSIVDEFLEHARVMYFYNKGKEEYYVSSADWMVRNLDYRIEVTTPILDEQLKEELQTILELQLKENVKGRILDNQQRNEYANTNQTRKVRSQLAIYQFLKKRKYD